MRPRLPAGIMLLALAIPLLIFGAYEIYTRVGHDRGVTLVTGRRARRRACRSDDSTPCAQAPEGEDPIDWPRTVLLTRLGGIACLVAALGCALGARRLIRKKRYYIVCRGAERMLKIEAKDEIQQTQIMVTVSAVKGKAPPGAVPPKA